MYVIKREIDRPDAEQIQAISRIPTPNISDALGRDGGMHSRIRPVFSTARLGGPAYTVLNYPKDNLMTHYALKSANPGDVIVVDNGCGIHGSGWGELMSIAAKVRGLGGVVIDGTVRDVDELSKIGLPIFAAGITAEGTVKVSPGGINCPVSCGGISVSPGDVIVGDENGVVVVPRWRLKEVIQTALAISEKEKTMRQRILNGETIYDILNLGQYLELETVRHI
jgi:4-hydroxy-4-methyl-2-oxoglutarate aldolase